MSGETAAAGVTPPGKPTKISAAATAALSARRPNPTPNRDRKRRQRSGSWNTPEDDGEWRDIQESVAMLTRRGVAAALDPKTRSGRYDDDGEFHPVKFIRAL